MSPLPSTQTVPAWYSVTQCFDTTGKLVRSTPITVVPLGGGSAVQLYNLDGTPATSNPLPPTVVVGSGIAGGADPDGNLQFGAAAGFYDLMAGARYIGTVQLGVAAVDIVTMLRPTAIKTAAYTAAPNDFVPTDTTGASITVTLPTSPPDGSRVGVKMVKRGGTNTTTVAAGGAAVFNVAGGATSLVLSLLMSDQIYQYKAGIWYVMSDDIPLGQLDGRYELGLIPTAVKTANYSASASDYVPVDTTGGSVTVTLPTAPPDRTRVGVKQVTRGGTNVVNLACSGTDVFNKAGGPTTGALTLLNQAAIFQYQAAGGIWIAQSDDLPLSQLDLRFLAIAAGSAASRYLDSAFRNLVAFGHSYPGGGGTSINTDQGFVHKLAAMLGAQLSNYARGGACATFNEQQGAGAPGGGAAVNGSGGWSQVIVQSSYNPASGGPAFIANAATPVFPGHTAGEPYTPPPYLPLVFYGNNDLGFTKYAGADPSGTQNLNAFLDAMRTIISRVTAAAVYDDAHSSVTYGAGWASEAGFGVGSGNSLHYNTGVGGGAVTIAVPSDYQAGDVIALGFAINPLNGVTGTATVAVDGSSAGLPNAGVVNLAPSRCNIPRTGVAPQALGIVYRIPASAGLANGAHTITITPGGSTPASSVVFDYWQVEPGADAAPISCIVPGLVHPYSYAIWGTPLVTDADVNAWDAAYAAMVAAEFPSALYVTMLDVVPRTSQYPYWVSDQAHPSDLGHTYLAGAIFDALAGRAASLTAQDIAYQAKDPTRPRLSMVTLPNTFSDFSVTGTGWQLVAPLCGGVLTPVELVLPARPGDIVEVGCGAIWDNAGVQLGCLDVGIMGGFAVAAPAVPSAITLGAGGSLTVAQQYYGWVTAYNGAGETIAQGPIPYPLPTAGNQTVTIAVAVPSGATGVRLYRTTSAGYPGSGVTMVQQIVLGSGTATFSDTGAALSGTFPPQVNTTGQSILRQVSGNGSSGIGIPGWLSVPSNYAPAAGSSFHFMVQPTDASGGMMLALLARLNGAGTTRHLTSVFGTTGLQMWAKNHGRQAGALDRAT